MKKLIMLGSVVLAVTLLIGCGQQQAKQTNIQNIKDESMTYQNEKYGFEFQYPSDWIINENASEITPKSPKKCGPAFVGEGETCLDSISFSIIENKNNLPLAELLNEVYGWEEGTSYKNLKAYKIGDINALTAITISAHDGGENTAFWVPIADGNFFMISGFYLDNEQESILRDIISGFKFKE